MADKRATSAGAWSTRSWVLDSDGSATTAPDSSDVVYLHNLALTLDQDLNILGLTNVVGVTATAGGSLTCSTARTINIGNSEIIAGSTSSPTLILSNTSGITVTIDVDGDIQGGGATGAFGVSITAGGTQNITCDNAIGGTASNTAGINIASTSTTTINGILIGGSSGTPSGCNIAASANVTINGDINGGTTTGAVGLSASTSPTVVINGNVAGSATHSASGVGLTSSSTVTVNGTVTGGGVSSSNGIIMSGATSMVVTCNSAVTGGTASGAFGIGGSGTNNNSTVNFNSSVNGGSAANTAGYNSNVPSGTGTPDAHYYGAVNASTLSPAITSSNSTDTTTHHFQTGSTLDNNGAIQAICVVRAYYHANVTWGIEKVSSGGAADLSIGGGASVYNMCS